MIGMGRVAQTTSENMLNAAELLKSAYMSRDHERLTSVHDGESNEEIAAVALRFDSTVEASLDRATVE